MVFRVIQADSTHVEEIVDCHIESFQGFFLTFLGRKFLGLFYKEVLDSDSGFGTVLLEGERVVGFAIGTTMTPGLYRRLLLRRGARFFVLSLPSLIKKPAIAIRLFRALFMHKTSQKFSSEASLLSIAVRNSVQKSGQGKVLINDFLKMAQGKGAKDLFLTTDAENNDSVNKFYLKCGFELKRTFLTPEKRKMNEYFFNFLSTKY